MAIIPQELKTLGFVLVGEKSKIPLEKNWQNNPRTYNEAITHFKKGGNYGILCGHQNFTPIDADHPSIVELVTKELPTTFTVKTGGGGTHFYYYSDLKQKIILRKENTHYGEIQSTGTQIIGANCTHPNGKKYEILKNQEIKTITSEEIKYKLREYLNTKPAKVYDDKIEEINITNVIDTTRLTKQGNEYFGHHPTHGSEGGANFWVNPLKNTWHCFRCNSGGDAYYWLAVETGILNCYEATPGQLRQDKFLQTLRVAQDRGLVKKPSKTKRIKTAMEEFINYRSMAEKFHEIQPIYYDKAKNWWLWNFEEMKWELIDDTDLMVNFNKGMSLGIVTQHAKNSIMESLRQVGRENSPMVIKKMWIQFKHTIVDIENNEEIFPSFDYFSTNPIPWVLGESEETPVMDKIFEEWVGKDHVQTLYEIIAYCMLSDYPLARVFCLVGSGLNGKSKFLELLTKMVGQGNVVSSDLDIMINSRFEASKLYKKLVCLMGETNFAKMNKTAIIKRLTGSDLISFEMKRKTPIDDYNYAKIMIATNSLPPTQDKTKGYYRRWLIVEFPYEFNEKRDILKDIPEEEYNNLAKKSVRVLKDLLRKREFYNEGSIEEKEKQYEDISNPLQKFLQEHVEEDFDSFITKEEFKEFFWGWQRQNGYRKWSDTQIGLSLKQEHHWEDGKRILDEDGLQSDNVSGGFTTGRRITTWEGVKWKGLKIQDDN